MRRELGMLVALIALCLGLLWSNHNFLGESNVFNTSRQISMLGILAIGSAFVIVTGGIDLSVGSMVGLTGVILAKISSNAEGGLGHPLWVGIPAAMGVALTIGLAQGLLITRLNLQPFIVTLGGMLTLRGVSQTIVHGGNISYSAFGSFANSAILRIDGEPILPVLLLLFLGVVVISAYLLHFTVFGRYLYAIGGNRDAAQYSGVPVKRVETITYVISAGLAGVAGICYASYINQMDQNVGVAFELSAIAACVLGGCSLRGGEGTVFGVIIGTGLMKVIEDGLDMFQIKYRDARGIPRFWHPDDNWKFIVIGAVILVAVILDQVVHLVQQRRRTRGTATPAAPVTGGFPVQPPSEPKVGATPP
ncbi:MAG: Sugar transport system permease [Phycisphaerales bacterium]|nr:Sugar transport system permease [Phycisphaerales bacterium]MDB5356899.1 Sugar transport system permease [Phycisphaerales bacterium]